MTRILVACLLLSGSLAAQEMIAIKSGNGAPGATDTQITFLPGPFLAPLTLTEFSNALAGAPAEVIPPNSFGWANNVSNDPTALWISTSQSGASHFSALYATTFNVSSTSIAAASLSMRFLVDETFGDAVNVGVFINTLPVAGTTTSNTVASWSLEQGFLNVDVTGLVTTGQNTIYFNLINNAGPGGVNFRADLSIFGTPPWQMNQPGASLDVDGLTNTPFGPILAARCVGQTSALNFSSTNVGLPWDVGVTSPEPGRGVGMGGLPLPGGQAVNLNLGAPSLIFLNNLTLTTPFPGSGTFPVSLPAPIDVSAQMVVIDPAQAAGASLSALNTITPAGSLPGPNGDDVALNVIASAPPLCGPTTITFAGTAYTDFFVNSNGSVSFSAGDTSFTPSVPAFQTGVPKLAGMWTDLSPNAGGTITLTHTAGVVRVSFVNVPEFATGVPNSMDMVLDSVTGAASIENYAPGASHATDTIVGLTPGGGATDPGPVSFLGLAGAGLNANLVTDMIYESLTGAAVPGGFTSIVWPLSDGSAWQVN